MACGKRPYASEKAAKRAHRRAGYRLRTYWCIDCRSYHVTNNEKRHRAENRNER